jgi:phosphate transport system substrate-binding protein
MRLNIKTLNIIYIINMKKTATLLRRTKKIFALFIASGFLFACLSQSCLAKESSFFAKRKRNYISIVGSSTVYPFTAVIAEKFGRRFENFRTPTVEATGTGGGVKLFCGGIGDKFPDFVNASRAIKSSEIENCKKNGIHEIVEIKIGYDGIVIANSIKGKKINLSKKQLFMALADKIPQNGELVPNYITKWSQIDKNLPDYEIRVYGPPPTSGTRDAFVELVMEEFCIDNATFIKKYPDKKIRAKICHTIRNDGHFIEAGENDNLILQKLKNDSEAFGIFGFSFLEENHNMIHAAKINFVAPNLKTILSGKYSVSRPLFIYFKKENLNKISGMKEFVQTILSPDALGIDGYLTQKGLIPLSDFELRRIRGKILKDL